MTDIALWAVPTTGQDRLESIFRYFQTAGPRTGGSEFWPVVVLVVAVLALGWLLSRFLTRSQQKQRPWALFLALCRRHRLSWRECRLLWQLARTHSPQMPARVFLEPELFQPDRLSNHANAKTALLEQLRIRLFGNLPADQTKSDTSPLPPAPGAETQESLKESHRSPEPVALGFPRTQAPSLEWPG
jgi:hypothetical protein